MRGGCAPLTSPYPPGLSWRHLKRRNDTGSSRIPSRLAHRARPIRQCQADATLSRLLPPSPAIPGSGCLQLRPRCCDSEADGRSLTSIGSNSASRRTATGATGRRPGSPSGSAGAARLGVGARPVPAHRPRRRDARAASPLRRRPCGLPGRRPAAGLRVDQDRRVDQALPQGEVVDAQDAGTPRSGRRIAIRARSAVCLETLMPSAASSREPARPANSRTVALTWPVSLVMRRWYRSRTPGTCSRKVCTWQSRAGQRIRRTLIFTTTRRPSTGTSAWRPLVIPVHVRGFLTAARAGHRLAPRPGPDHDRVASVLNILDDQGRQPREHSPHKLFGIDHD